MAPPTIASIFHAAQLSLSKHRACSEALYALRAAATDRAAFDDDVFACIACVLRHSKREKAAEKVVGNVLEFIVQFATKHGGEAAFDEDFVERVSLRLLKLSASKDKAVRFRSVQLIGQMLERIGDEVELSDELFEEVEAKMLERCRDREQIVRAAATKAVARLQDPSQGKQDKVTAELLRMLNDDDKVEVRMAAMAAVAFAISPITIKAVLQRIRDVSAEVRLHALQVLMDKVKMRWLTIAQRVELLEAALQDRVPEVAAKAAELVLRGWLLAPRESDQPPCGCGGDVLELLRALDWVSHESTAALALKAIAQHEEAHGGAKPSKQATKKSEGLLEAAAASWAATDGPAEAVRCLRAQLEQLRECHSADVAAEAAPELAALCDALVAAGALCKGAATTPAHAARLAELARVAAMADVRSDEHGRVQLVQHCRELLAAPSTPDAALEPLFEALCRACPPADEPADEAEGLMVPRYAAFAEEVLGAIDEVINPEDDAGDEGAEGDDAVAQARMDRQQRLLEANARLLELADEVKAAVAAEDLEAACLLRNEYALLDAEVADLEAANRPQAAPEVLAQRSERALRLTVLLLASDAVTSLENFKLDDLIAKGGRLDVDLIAKSDVDCRTLAMQCYGLYGQTSAERATKVFPLLREALRIEQPKVRLAALRATLDLLLLHSPAALLPPPSAADAETDAEANDRAAEATEKGAPGAPEEDAYANAVWAFLSPALEGPPGSLRRTAVLGVCKLLHTRALRSSSLLAQLLLVHFEPAPAAPAAAPAGSEAAAAASAAADDAAQLAQTLALFFGRSAAAGDVGRAVLPALRTVAAAAEGSRFASVPLDKLLPFALDKAAEAARALATKRAAVRVESGTLPAAKAAKIGAAAAAEMQLEIGLALACEAVVLVADEADGEGAEEHKEVLKAIAKTLGTIDVGREALNSARLATLVHVIERYATMLSRALDKPSMKHVEKLREKLQALLAKRQPLRDADAREAAEGEAAEGEVEDEEEDDEEELEAPSLSASEVLDLHRGLRSALQLKAGTTKEQQRRASLGLDGEDAARGGARQPMRRVAKEPANRKAAPSKAVPKVAPKAKYVEDSDEDDDDEDDDDEDEEDYLPAKKAASVTASKGRQPRGTRVDENAALLNVAPVS